MLSHEYLSYYMFLSKIKGIGPVRYNHILQVIEKKGITIKEFFKDFILLRKDYPFLPQNIDLAESSIKLNINNEKKIIEKLLRNDVKIYPIKHAKYPKKLINILGLSSPPVLYIKGDLNILSHPNLAIVGTRNPTPQAKNIARKLTGYLTLQNKTIVSGYAKGIDEIAHNTCLYNSGKTVIILGYGISHFHGSRLCQYNDFKDNILVISEFYPSAPWNNGYLMTRNKTISALSDATIVIETRFNGGAYQTGNYTLSFKKSLYTIHFELETVTNMGNNKLIELGAIPVSEKLLNNELNLDHIFT